MIAGVFVAGVGTLVTILAQGYWSWIVTAGVMGVGMALLYPNLITVVGDAAHLAWRATSLGVYRMWRDAGYGFGAILIGVTADFVSIWATFYGVAAAVVLSGGVALVWTRETHPVRGNHGAPSEADQRLTGDD